MVPLNITKLCLTAADVNNEADSDEDNTSSTSMMNNGMQGAAAQPGMPFGHPGMRPMMPGNPMMGGPMGGPMMHQGPMPGQMMGGMGMCFSIPNRGAYSSLPTPHITNIASVYFFS